MFRIATRVWMVTRNPASRHIRAIDRSLGTGERGARGKKRAQKRGVWRQYRKGRRHGFPESSTTLWRNPITSLANNVGKLLGSWTTYPRNNGLWRLWVLEADLDLGIPSWITFLLAPVPIFSFPTRDLRNNLFYTYCTRVGSPGDHHPAAINQFRFSKMYCEWQHRKTLWMLDLSWIPLYMVVGGREAKPNICVPRRCLNHSNHDAYHVPHFSKYNAFLLVPFSCSFMRGRSFANSTMQSNASRDVRINPALHGSVHCPVALWNISGSSPILLWPDHFVHRYLFC